MIATRRAFLALPFVLAACSTGVTPTAGPTSIPTAGVTAAPTAAPTAGGTVVPAPATQGTATPGPSLSGDLVSLMPTEIAGNAMTIEPASDPANSFMILWNEIQVAQDLLFDLGAAPTDIDIVFSYPTESSFPNTVRVDAYRVAGADAVALRDGMVENYRTYVGESTPVSVTQATVAGKEVVVMTVGGAPVEQGQHFYAIGDIVFVVSGSPFEWVEDAFAQLP